MKDHHQNEVFQVYQDYLKLLGTIQQQNDSCLHNGCSECHGTGRKENGQMCVHMISCPCPRCTPRY